MPLTPPNLDSRTFEQLFEQARARIPNYVPEWTDWNESDPGIALLQLQAWLTETILFELNRLPELNYYKFLKLLGVERRPAVPASSDVTFILDPQRIGAKSEIEIPRNTLLRVSSRDLPEPVYFETDETLTAINATLALLVATTTTHTNVTDVTLANEIDGEAFKPFVEVVSVGAGDPSKPALLLGFSSALPFTRREFGLQIFLKDEPLGPLEDSPAQDDCGPEPTDPLAPQVGWEWFDGLVWEPVNVSRDETEQLRRSGRVYLTVPGQIPAVPALITNFEPIVEPVGLEHVKHVNDAIRVVFESTSSPAISSVADLAAADEGEIFELVKDHLTGADDDEKKDQVTAMIKDAKRLSLSTSPPLYYWLRAVFEQGSYPQPVEITRILINTVGVTQAQTAVDEVVGSSDGMPNQVMQLRHMPVLQPQQKDQPALILEVDEGEGPKEWTQVSDFAESEPASQHYVLNRTTGEIRFGDNHFGKIPRAGQANVIARHYRYGGGQTGNVGARTIKELVRPITGVREVFNFRGAEGGDDEEPLAETLMRVPRDMRANNRAVTLDDFALLARQTPGAQVVRAYAFLKEAADDGDACRTQIHVVIVPRTTQPRPSPTETAIRMVCRYLDERRLVTTQVTVSGPTYHDIAIEAHIKAENNADRRAVKEAVEARIRAYLHPLQGGSDGQGWPFGRDIYYSELVRELMAIPGVLRVDSLEVLKLVGLYDTQQEAEAHGSGVKAMKVHNLLPGADKPWAAMESFDCQDMPVDEGKLLALFSLDVRVEYDRTGAP